METMRGERGRILSNEG
jgi:hypothetical protein